ncbi:hypothetical protein [Microscilla marina]|nr:hypothetical protein [Microscilla marina]
MSLMFLQACTQSKNQGNNQVEPSQAKQSKPSKMTTAKTDEAPQEKKIGLGLVMFHCM